MTLPFKHDLNKIKRDKESDFWMALRGKYVWLEETAKDSVSYSCFKVYFYAAKSIKKVYEIYEEE